MKIKNYTLLQVIIIIVITSIISAITSGVIVTRSYSKKVSGYSTILVDDNIREFLRTYNELTNDYFEDIDKKGLIKSAIKAMTDYLSDSYTMYMDGTSTAYFNDNLSGSYKGIGVKILGNEVVEVLDDSPALDVGILKGDIIVEIDGTSTSDLSSTDITYLIKGKNSINMKVTRDDETIDFIIQVGDVKINNTSFDIKDDIGYLKIDVFSENVYDNVLNAINDMNDKKIKGLIIDVRNNGGGYLNEVSDIAQLFLKKGKIIYSIDTKGKVTKYKDENDLETSYPIVVLINGSSASASEILAASLKESYGAILVGNKSYGKGKVQHAYNLSDGDMIKYTSSKWLTPSGNCIDEIGISPDYEIDNIELEDLQLDKAYELLK